MTTQGMTEAPNSERCGAVFVAGLIEAGPCTERVGHREQGIWHRSEDGLAWSSDRALLVPRTA